MATTIGKSATCLAQALGASAIRVVPLQARCKGSCRRVSIRKISGRYLISSARVAALAHGEKTYVAQAAIAGASARSVTVGVISGL